MKIQKPMDITSLIRMVEWLTGMINSILTNYLIIKYLTFFATILEWNDYYIYRHLSFHPTQLLENQRYSKMTHSG